MFCSFKKKNLNKKNVKLVLSNNIENQGLLFLTKVFVLKEIHKKEK
jgi:hypothetical protein